MELGKIISVMLLISTQSGIFHCKKETPQEKRESSHVKDVIVIGGGLAGMAAARQLHEDKNINVRVLEARKERYGGRIWTKRGKTKGIKGVDRELGGTLLNTKAYNNTFEKLLQKFDIDTVSPGSVQIIFPSDKKVLSGDQAQELYTELFTIIVNAVKTVKASKNDRPLDIVIREAIDDYEGTDDRKDMLLGLVNTLPTPLCQNFSTLLYDIQSEFGWNAISVNGVDDILDRVVAGEGMELPLKIELNKVVRNIKIDDNRQKVLVRTIDRKQLVADAVVLAVPIGVLKSKSIIIEPKMPKAWYQAVNDIGVGYSNKVIVGFEKAFWPKDIGAFTVSSETAVDGFLQMWTNSYKFSGNPYLVGNIFGAKAKEWETAKQDDLKKKVIQVLGEMFGAEKVAAHKIKVFYVSKWSTDEFSLGSVSYPRVGNSADLWETLSRPACPYLYFAGAHTLSLGHVDSLHGAYHSGITAANQILSNICHNQSDKKKAKTKNKTPTKASSVSKTKQKKDEL